MQIELNYIVGRTTKHGQKPKSFSLASKKKTSWPRQRDLQHTDFTVNVPKINQNKK